MGILERIDKSSDLKGLSFEEMSELAGEIRQEIISVVSQNGGHLSSNLGAVELTLALHYCLDIPTDQLVWDVGHQSYTHKIITGRREQFKKIRKAEGLSGFPKRAESDADPFGAGHASTSISAALGLATARDIKGLHHKVVAVIGDGALTGGLSYEGLNNAGASKRDMIVILNDNNMSISKNVGALSKHLTGILVDPRYNRLRNEIWELTGRFKRRDKIRKWASHLEDSLKSFIVPGFFFDRLGFRYFGPIDGHDLALLVKTIDQIKNLSGPRLLHVLTTKGKGYPPAEADATKYHGIGSFDKLTGRTRGEQGRPSYTDVFGESMMMLAAKHKEIVVITAAMTSGTGLGKFAEKYPDRLHDVGIAEGHGVCFAAGLAAGGMKPFVAIYSTFLQRAYDQIIHDIALQKLPVVFCIDRAGIVGEDGPTHHGAFDISYLTAVPNLTLMAPADSAEFKAMLDYVAKESLDGPVAIRYPRASVPLVHNGHHAGFEWGKWEEIYSSGTTALIACGAMVETALMAREVLHRRLDVAVINARFIKPVDEAMLERCMAQYENIIVLEENGPTGGLGQAVGTYLQKMQYGGGFLNIGIPDRFVPQGTRMELLKSIGLNAEAIAEQVVLLEGEHRILHKELGKNIRSGLGTE